MYNVVVLLYVSVCVCVYTKLFMYILMTHPAKNVRTCQHGNVCIYYLVYDAITWPSGYVQILE